MLRPGASQEVRLNVTAHALALATCGPSRALRAGQYTLHATTGPPPHYIREVAERGHPTGIQLPAYSSVTVASFSVEEQAAVEVDGVARTAEGLQVERRELPLWVTRAYPDVAKARGWTETHATR